MLLPRHVNPLDFCTGKLETGFPKPSLFCWSQFTYDQIFDYGRRQDCSITIEFLSTSGKVNPEKW
ncbi:MAG: hypothetical protein KA714_27280 [Limnoraphis sp. WC205]|nr:hypothetical protein [Limnoraphis sp. WC205]